jgi:hypothetical protein
MDQHIVDEQMTYYRKRAQEYDETTGQTEDLQRAFARARDLLQQHAPVEQILELACGTGTWTRALLPLGRELTAIDASPEMLSLAREIGGQRGRPVPASRPLPVAAAAAVRPGFFRQLVVPCSDASARCLSWHRRSCSPSRRLSCAGGPVCSHARGSRDHRARCGRGSHLCQTLLTQWSNVSHCESLLQPADHRDPVGCTGLYGNGPKAGRHLLFPPGPKPRVMRKEMNCHLFIF